MTRDDFEEISECDELWNGLVEAFLPKITIGRVMQALYNRNKSSINVDVNGAFYYYYGDDREFIGIVWNLTKKNGQECTDDDQSDEIISKLLTLLK
ncbi:MAG TPA: hypothetical protein VMZ91_03600 [Candidatus Paceibacterota bacterium]|nr:hypothetical protein [Candidatus Paceibacterota bacterium]